MKTQVIQLENHDDVISTQDKMMWSKSPRILLVWPGTKKILNHKADLVLLLRLSRRLGTQLAIITHDKRVKFYANDIGLPVFDSITAAQRRPWRRPWLKNIASNLIKESSRATSNELRDSKPFAKTKEEPKNFIRIGSFLVGFLACFSLLVFFLPVAQVHLDMKEKEQSVTFDILANQETNNPSINGTIPAYTTSVIVEGMDNISSSGTKMLPEGSAKGTVQFTNISNHIVEISAGTIVMTLGDNPVRFQTLKKAVCSNLNDEPVEVEVQAVEPGGSGNVQAGEIIAIEGETGLFVSVFNSTPLSGGSEREVPNPTENDYTELSERLFSTL
ncbi:MAG: baseplate J/gp47 family protein, partial [Anaerolineaceae bacterium]|nr:baseplate J/gp47 family protein [Anaerolineaceae bacterium]